MPSEYVRKGFASSGVLPEKLVVVRHGVPKELCNSSPTRGNERSREGTKFRFLYHGGLLWRKGIDRLLQAYSLAFTGNRDVQLYVHSVYGDDDVYDYVKQFIKQSEVQGTEILFSEGRLTTTELSDLYANADVFVQPSRSEGFGLGSFEAMATGLPIVISDYGPSAEYITNETGFLFDAHTDVCTKSPCSADGRVVFTNDYMIDNHYTWGEYSAQSLADAMLRAYQTGWENLTTVGMTGKQMVCDRLSWDDIYSQVQHRLLEMAGTEKLA